MKLFKKLYWRLYIVGLSLRWIPSLNIGDEVIHKGKRYSLSDGRYSHRWDLYDREKKELLKQVHSSEIKKVCSIKNYWGSFKSGYRFYMWSWYKIWLNVGIEPWMRGCNIWKKEPKPSAN